MRSETRWEEEDGKGQGKKGASSEVANSTTKTPEKKFEWCGLCFGDSKGIYQDHSSLSANVSDCYCCGMLHEAIEKCATELRKTRKHSNIECQTYAIIRPSSTQRFTLCKLVFVSGVAYDLIIGCLSRNPAHTQLFGRSTRISPSKIKDPNELNEAAKKWISTCIENHSACKRRQSPALPDRVICIDSEDPVLYISKNTEAPYATLSHCWEHSQPLKIQTTNANLSEYQRRLVWNNLPKAFQESIDFVRSLGIRYLWIDSLCIVQDDQDDWEQNSGRMANIYQNSTVTLAMHQPSPGSASIPKTFYSFYLKHHQNFRVNFQLRDHAPDIEKSRIFERGWCFQVSG
jgi:Heterokaryon incompatibility protein (HET)